MIRAANATDDVYHYTSAAVGIDSVVQQMQFRLGLFEATNDPRESKPRYPALTLADGVTADPATTQKMWEEADRMVRRAAKVACFTLDYELPDTVFNAQAERGYAHPALWAHYGGAHSGVCLQFSRAALAKRFSEALAGRTHLFEGPVEYATHGEPEYLDPLDVEQITEFGLDAVVHLFVRRHHRVLFFRKHADWANEREYRWIALDPDPVPIYVDVSECLRGIVLGDAFAESRRHAVQLLAEERGLTLRQVTFFNGTLQLVPVTLAAPGESAVAARRPGSLAERTEELARAEESARAARDRGAEAASPYLARISAAVSEIATRMRQIEDVEVDIMRSLTAVPPSERHRAPGTSHAHVDYEAGWMCVAENLPRQSATFVAAVALQVLKPSQCKLHAVFETELWLQSGNERNEVWRGASEVQLDQNELEAALEALLDTMVEHLRIAVEQFDEIRRRPRPG